MFLQPSLGARVPSRATPEGTAAYAARFSPSGSRYSILGKTGLTCSRLGFSARRVDDKLAEHHQALQLALTSGINLIDTAVHYADGGSETTIGEALGELFDAGTLTREEVILVTKAGRLSGGQLADARRREGTEDALPDVVRYSERLWNCIHPRHLAEAVQASLRRLRVRTLDICLLHDPEYFLRDAFDRLQGTLDERRAEFRRRLGLAFAFLEDEVRTGRLGSYGVCSESFADARDVEIVRLDDLVEIAREVAGNSHHMRVIQVPLNLLEPHAALERRDGLSLLDSAKRLELAVLACRPLCMRGPQPVRLVEPTPFPPQAEFEAQVTILAALETAYWHRFAVHAISARRSRHRDFGWAEHLAAMKTRLILPGDAGSAEQRRTLRRMQQDVREIGRALPHEVHDAFRAWRDCYWREVKKLFDECRRLAAETARRRVRRMEAALDPLFPGGQAPRPFSRTALWIATSTAGVHCVATGMRQRQHVREALEVLSWRTFERSTDGYRAVASIDVFAEET